MVFQRVGRCSPRQLIFILFSMIMVSSLVTDTLAAFVLDQRIVTAVCDPETPLLRLTITTSGSALSKAKCLTTQFLKKELNKEYADAIVNIHTFKSDWNVIEDIPKTPNSPTPQNTLEEMHEKNTLEKIFKDLHAVREGMRERRTESHAMKLPFDETMFDNLDKEVEPVIEAVQNLLPGFRVKIPEIPSPSPATRAEDKAEHDMRNWILLHDYIILMEFTHDVARYLLKEYCGLTID